MDTEARLSVKGIIDTEFAVSSEDGRKLFDVISVFFNNNVKVELSFDGIQLITPSFFNFAVGWLYRDFEETFVESHLVYVNLPEHDDERYIRILCSHAIRYFKNYEYFTGLTEKPLACMCGENKFEVTYVTDNRDQEHKWSGTQLKCINCGDSKIINKEIDEW